MADCTCAKMKLFMRRLLLVLAILNLVAIPVNVGFFFVTEDVASLAVIPLSAGAAWFAQHVARRKLGGDER